MGKIDGKKRNLSLYLVEQGFGRLLRFSAERSPYADELFALEKAAKDSKLRIWENYVERVREDPTETETKVESYNARIAYIESGQEFYLTRRNDLIQTIESQLAAYADKPTGDDALVPAAKMLVAAEYDGAWYRARIDKVVRPDEEGGKTSTLCEISFVDYGNKDCVEPSSLRPLTDDLQKPPPQAVQCNLAFVKVPGLEKQFGDAAAQYLAELTWDQKLSIQDVSVDEGVKSVIITANSEGSGAAADASTVNALMCRKGLSRFKPPFVPRYQSRGKKRTNPFEAVLKSIKAAHAAAAKEKSATGMFAYGDFDSDDDPKRDAF